MESNKPQPTLQNLVKEKKDQLKAISLKHSLKMEEEDQFFFQDCSKNEMLDMDGVSDESTEHKIYKGLYSIKDWKDDLAPIVKERDPDMIEKYFEKALKAKDVLMLSYPA